MPTAAQALFRGALDAKGVLAACSQVRGVEVSSLLRCACLIRIRGRRRTKSSPVKPAYIWQVAVVGTSGSGVRQLSLRRRHH